MQGAHSVRSGVAGDPQPQGSERPRRTTSARSTFNTAGNPNTTGNALADALLGNFRTYNEASADPVGFFRFTQYQAFVSDTWRVRDNLSIEAGVRYEYAHADLHAGQNNIVELRSRAATTRPRR